MRRPPRSHPTDRIEEGHPRAARALRRVALAILFVFLGLGVTGFFGVRSATATASGGGYTLTVEYAAVTRAGLATPWAVEVRHAGGFDGPVTLATTSDYMDIFDENGLDPDPATSTSTATETIWTFDPPPGDVLRVSFDARLEPAVSSGKAGRTTLLVEGRPAVSVGYRTRVMP